MPPINIRPDLEKRVNDLETLVSQLAKAGSVSASQGSVSFPPGTNLRVLDVDGTSLANIGSFAGSTRPDGNPEQGTVLRRDNGTIALSVQRDSSNPALYRQIVILWDGFGKPLWFDDGAAGGMGRPYLAIQFQTVRPADMLQTTSATFEDIVKTRTMYKQHPKIMVSIECVADAGTAGEVQVLLNGTVSSAGVSAVTTTQQTYFGVHTVPGAVADYTTVTVQARRTSGTGSVRLSVAGIGRQS